jgi:hypothetical protein
MLPVDARYRLCLNAPLLQNLGPEHVRAEALALKPAMVATHEEQGLKVPKWVSTIA